LDVMIPGVDGFEVCEQVRPQFKGAILILTGVDDEHAHIRGLELGADDYVTKPVTPPVLLARLRALLRRIKTPGPRGDGEFAGLFHDDSFVVGEMTIVASARDVKIGPQSIDLTTLEYELLVLLAQRAGVTVERDLLYQALLEREYDGLDRTIDVHISRLRKKLAEGGGSADWIKTIHGRGYQLILQES
ncbi:MAG: winged helix-turn-helix domain-containing protein, partial [Bradymonadaceae bacterium]